MTSSILQAVYADGTSAKLEIRAVFIFIDVITHMCISCVIGRFLPAPSAAADASDAVVTKYGIMAIKSIMFKQSKQNFFFSGELRNRLTNCESEKQKKESIVIIIDDSYCRCF